ncbi:MAG: flippase [bacterium]
MTGDRVLARNTLLNFAGQLLPAIAAFIAVPILVRAIGLTRFGILTLVWTAVGYFSLFDFGIGRALTHAIATRLGAVPSEGVAHSDREHHVEDMAAVTWTALFVLLILGMVGGLIVFVATPTLVARVLNIPAEMQPEARSAFYILSLALPLTLLTLGLRGVLEAFQDFGVATALRLPLAVLSYFAPIAVLPFSHDLIPIVGSLFVARLLGLLLHLWACARRYAFMRRPTTARASLLGPLLGFGGWMTVSNVVSPLMVNLDRFMVGALLPMASVAYYTTPYEAVAKIWLIPAALLGVLFPAFAAAFAGASDRTAILLDRGVRVTIVAVFPICLAVVALAHEGMGLWIGSDFSKQSAPLMQWLAVGVFINSAAQVAFTALQGTGRPDQTAKLHLIEFPLYAAAVWLLARAYGLTGVAIAWDLRVTVDAILLFALVAKQVPSARARLVTSYRAVTVAVALMIGAALMQTSATRVAAFVAGLIVFAGLTWTTLIRIDERDLLKRWLKGLTARGGFAESA